MKKILILNYEFPPLGSGAANASFYLLSEAAKNHDLQIDLVTSSSSSFKVERFSNNIKIHRLNIFKNNKNLQKQSFFNLLAYSFKAYFYCKKLHQNNKYQLCHAFFGIPCGYIACKLKIPYIVSLRGSDVPFYNSRFYFLDVLFFKKMSIKIWNRAILVIANSESLKELALKSSPSQEISIIPNGVDSRLFKFKGFNKDTKYFHIVSTGRLIKRKNYDILIKSLKGVKNVELSLVGNGPLLKKLKRLSRKNNIAVNFIDHCNKSKLVEVLHSADVFSLLSSREGMSNSLLEAMSCGLPLIVSDTGDSSSLVCGNGIVLESVNEDTVREAILDFLKNKENLKEMSNKSRLIAERMAWNKSFISYLDVYEKYISPKL